MSPPRFLIVDSEPERAREKKRALDHAPSAESFGQTLLTILPGAFIERVDPTTAKQGPSGGLSSYNAVFLSGSPIHFDENTAEVQRIIEFMRAVFISQVPAFGSCAGLQIATVAAGGRVGPKTSRHEAGIARLIYQTPQGLVHPLLSGRSPSFDAPAVHSDEVKELPASAVVLPAARRPRSRQQKSDLREGYFGACSITQRFRSTRLLMPF